MTPSNVIEIIMAQHWDFVACDCWVCEAGRENGLAAYEHNLPRFLSQPYGYVRIDGAWMEKGNDNWGNKPTEPTDGETK